VLTTQAIEIICDGGTVINSTFHRANADTEMPDEGDLRDDIQFDIENPREGDFWEITVANDGAGKCNEKLAEIAPASLPTDVSPTFTDSNFASISIS
jgi:hypothetical protein